METRRWRSAWLAGLGACLAMVNVARLAGHELAVDPVGWHRSGQAVCCSSHCRTVRWPVRRTCWEAIIDTCYRPPWVGGALLPLPMELKLALGVGLSIALMQGTGADPPLPEPIHC